MKIKDFKLSLLAGSFDETQKQKIVEIIDEYEKQYEQQLVNPINVKLQKLEDEKKILQDKASKIGEIEKEKERLLKLEQTYKPLIEEKRNKELVEKYSKYVNKDYISKVMKYADVKEEDSEEEIVKKLESFVKENDIFKPVSPPTLNKPGEKLFNDTNPPTTTSTVIVKGEEDNNSGGITKETIKQQLEKSNLIFNR